MSESSLHCRCVRSSVAYIVLESNRAVPFPGRVADTVDVLDVSWVVA